MADNIEKEEDADSLLMEDGSSFILLEDGVTSEETGILRSVFSPIFSNILKEI